MKGKVKLISAMIIFGSIGLVVREMNLSSGQIALYRGVIGSLFLLSASLLTKERISWQVVRRNGWLLLLCGSAIGFNWILLFESYRYTTIANATLSYYFAPVFVTLFSPVLLKEKLTKVKGLCLFSAVAGMFLISGAGSGEGQSHLLGITYGLMAAGLYACVILTNKFLKGLSGLETTFIQLLVATAILVPYVMKTEGIFPPSLDSKSMLLIVTVGMIHTGFAYFLYFTAIKDLPGQTIAVYSYIDPISAILMSAVLLGERMTMIQICGGILILGATAAGEITGLKKWSPGGAG